MVFLTKKQKAQMRQRKRKAKQMARLKQEEESNPNQKQEEQVNQQQPMKKAVMPPRKENDNNPQDGEDEIKKEESSFITTKKKRKLDHPPLSSTTTSQESSSSEQEQQDDDNVASSPSNNKAENENENENDDNSIQQQKHKFVFVTIPVPEQFVQVFNLQEIKKKKTSAKDNPSGSSDQKASKEWKKYRKDQRRKYRKKYPGIPDENIIFEHQPANNNNNGRINNDKSVQIEIREPSAATGSNVTLLKDSTTTIPTLEAEGTSTSNQNKKKKFPCINDLLKEQEEQAKREAKQMKQKELWDMVPTEIKSKYVALDCEMVGVGSDGKSSRLARVTIVDWDHNVLLDTFVKVPEKVTDFRTWVSGVRPKDIRPGINSQAMSLNEVRQKVGTMIQDKIVVGHSLKNDFKALLLDHPRLMVRDTALYAPYMRRTGSKKNQNSEIQKPAGKLRSRKLKELALEKLGREIQRDGEAHTSEEDAIAAMDLYKYDRDAWEKEIERKQFKSKKRKR